MKSALIGVFRSNLSRLFIPVFNWRAFFFQSAFDIADADETIVIDFKNASILGRFHHYISDKAGNVVAEARGGIESETKNTFLMRHEREFSLPPGQYKLITELVSTYFIAEPQPYWDTLTHYREAMKVGHIHYISQYGHTD